MSTRHIFAVVAFAAFVTPASRAGDDELDATQAKLLLTSKKGKPIDGLFAFDVSKNGRFVVFSTSESLVAEGSPSSPQIYWRDRKTGKTMLVSRGHDGEFANDWCFTPVVSDDGKRVAFVTAATNFGASTGGKRQVVLVDLPTSSSWLISVDGLLVPASADCGRIAISGDGSVVAFGSASTNLAPFQPAEYRVYAHDASTGQSECVSVSTSGAYADSQASEPSLSFDGRYVAFESNATNLPTPGSGVQNKILVRDRKLSSTALVSTTIAGGLPNVWCSNPSISADGRFVAFTSKATDLTADSDPVGTDDVFVFDRDTGSRRRIAGGLDASLAEYFTDLVLSDNGRRVAVRATYDNSTNPSIESSRIRIYDRKTLGSKVLTLVPDYAADPDSSVTDVTISGNGRRVWFGSLSDAIAANPNAARTAFDLATGKIP